MTTDTSPYSVECRIDSDGIASLIINRPDRANAFNAETINALIAEIEKLTHTSGIRGLRLEGVGKNFSAGADAEWMRSMASKSIEENQQDAMQLADLLDKLDNFPQPTMAIVQGAAFGGALGLVCCCDMVVAHTDAKFCLSEVKLGLVPATIAPYVIRAMGVRNARRYMLTAELIDAEIAMKLQIAHQVLEKNDIEQYVKGWFKSILNFGPQALIETKKLCLECDGKEIDASMRQYTSELIARIRASEEGQEGLSAFLEKRLPNWSSN